MDVLVTGGAGFIGSNFIQYLLDESDHGVVTLDILTYAGKKENLGAALNHPRHEFIEGDIRDRELVNKIVTEVDAIVNFAAESHVDRSINNSKPFVSSNVQGTQVLLDAARTEGIEKFVQISTDEVYGEIVDGAFSESDPLKPRNPYAATKAGADHLAMSYYTTYDLPVAITRSSNNFGPRQHSEKLIPKLIQRASRGESLPLYGDGSNVREWTFVEDNCRAIDLVLSEGKRGEIYNIGSGEEYSNLEIAKKIVDAVGTTADLIEFVDDRPGHDQRYALDSTKIRDLGWSPRFSFEEGLRLALDYYLD